MSRKKAAALLALEGADRSLYIVKRNLHKHWRTLSHDEWVEFCNRLGQWLLGEAHDEWDEYVKANKKRKEEDLKRAEIAAIKAGKKSEAFVKRFIEKHGEIE